jgi:TRAP-type mannitol/chloroaromatic compound transport system permease large subunit
MNRAAYFGFGCIGLVLLSIFLLMPPLAQWSSGHYGLLMLALIVVAIMLGFPTAFTLMGLGMLFGFVAFYDPQKYWWQNQIFELMVQRTYGTMTNEVLISIPLFVFMGYVVERANIIDRLFHSVQRAMGNVPGALAVATVVTCAIFATATGIVGAVVTLMGLLALPAMLRAGYDVKLSAGAITAGGCLGILIPPSVLLILYGATAGVSVVQLYAGAFLPGIMLATLYVLYVVGISWLRPGMAPKLPPSPPVELPEHVRVLQQRYSRRFALAGAVGVVTVGLAKIGIGAPELRAIRYRGVLRNGFGLLFPALLYLGIVAFIWHFATIGAVAQPAARGAPPAVAALDPGTPAAPADGPAELGVEPREAGAEEAPRELGAGDAPRELGAADTPREVGADDTPVALGGPVEEAVPRDLAAVLPWLYAISAIGLLILLLYYWRLDYERFDILWGLVTSFFPLAILILAVLGSIVMGLATPSEAAAMGALGAIVLAIAYRQLTFGRLKESVFLTARTTAMVCWLFVGSALFSATFALLGGQALIEAWVLSLDLTPIQFMLLSQVIIFLLGWPLEWTEIIVIFMPIFVPLLTHFDINPLFFGLIVALNLQTAFLSPPVAMAAFYLKGVAPPHVTLNQIFAGMLPFMGIQVVAMFLLYQFPAIGLWLPRYLYQ